MASETTCSRDLLSLHETVSQFEETFNQQCFHMTSLCPDQCGHGGMTAVFKVLKYLKYEKPGQYGDKQQANYYVRLNDKVSSTGLTDLHKSILGSLQKGDFVLLNWHHDYVHREGCHSPERPIVKLEKITEADAKKLL